MQLRVVTDPLGPLRYAIQRCAVLCGVPKELPNNLKGPRFFSYLLPFANLTQTNDQHLSAAYCGVSRGTVQMNRAGERGMAESRWECEVGV
jgi:hypothetical protein